MTVTGPGCLACAYTGTVSVDVPPVRFPCGACSPWMRPAAFPDAALRAQADRILVDSESASPAMRAWAARLVADAKENE